MYPAVKVTFINTAQMDKFQRTLILNYNFAQALKINLKRKIESDLLYFVPSGRNTKKQASLFKIYREGQFTIAYWFTAQ